MRRGARYRGGRGGSACGDTAPFGVDIVRVWDREHTRIYYTGITHMVDRPRGGQPNRVVVFGEGREGGAPPILVWFPIGSPKGHEFIYTN